MSAEYENGMRVAFEQADDAVKDVLDRYSGNVPIIVAITEVRLLIDALADAATDDGPARQGKGGE